MSIGEKIRYIREKKMLLSQTAFSKKLGVSQGKVSRAENNNSRKVQKEIIEILVNNHGYTEDYFHSGSIKEEIEASNESTKDKYIRLLEEKLKQEGVTEEVMKRQLELMRMAEELREQLERMEKKLDAK